MSCCQLPYCISTLFGGEREGYGLKKGSSYIHIIVWKMLSEISTLCVSFLTSWWWWSMLWGVIRSGLGRWYSVAKNIKVDPYSYTKYSRKEWLIYIPGLPFWGQILNKINFLKSDQILVKFGGKNLNQTMQCIYQILHFMGGHCWRPYMYNCYPCSQHIPRDIPLSPPPIPLWGFMES